MPSNNQQPRPTLLSRAERALSPPLVPHVYEAFYAQDEMDTLNSAFVVEHITQTITSLLTILQTSRQATAHFEIQGLIEVLLSCKSLWLQSGYELCLFHKTVSFSDQTVVEFQELINRSSILCEALRSQTSLDECFGGDLERGYIGVLVFREREARRTETVVTEQLRVLSKLVEVCEPSVTLYPQIFFRRTHVL